jgi:2-polyprenyl-3-methyl-5-hydroxy-6-metoxy-1,4-benzoquinol methylase
MKKTAICNICGSAELTLLAKRSDDQAVLVCKRCGMGVVDLIPEDTSVLYDDSYYHKEESDIDSGYLSYDANSEHGVLWASELVNVMKRGENVLDIGCANGYLLNHLNPEFKRYGIEANSKAAKVAEQSGVRIIGNDILDPKLISKYGEYFDVITAIAVFEHISDFKGAVEAALKMLKPDGILIFEVPLISVQHNNETWFNSSLEHIYYPSEKAIHHLFNAELNTPMVGEELIIRDYASTFVGIATPEKSFLPEIKKVHERLVTTSPEKLTTAERRVQLLLKVIHAADPMPAHMPYLPELFKSDRQIPFLSRCFQLWNADFLRLQDAKNYIVQLEAAKEWHQEMYEKRQEPYEKSLANWYGRLKKFLGK